MYRTSPVVFALLAACASQTRIAEPIRAAIAARHAGQAVELRQSCYYGDLYDENEKWLLSPYPFAETYHIVDTKGVPIHPQGQRGIVPAGTRFVIQRVEFPDLAAISMRMLTTPRYNPWIYLTPAADAEGLPRERRVFILLLPMDMKTEDDVERAIAELLSPEGEMRDWLAARSPSIAVAIKHKSLIVGMSAEEMTAAVGSPRRWFNDQHGDQAARVAWYPSSEAWLVDGKVVRVEKARPASDLPSRARSQDGSGGG